MLMVCSCNQTGGCYVCKCAEIDRLRAALVEMVAAVSADITAGYDESERAYAARSAALALIPKATPTPECDGSGGFGPPKDYGLLGWRPCLSLTPESD